MRSRISPIEITSGSCRKIDRKAFEKLIPILALTCVCEICGKSIALTMPEIEDDLVDLCKQQGFKVSAHTIEISGLCVDCQRIQTPMRDDTDARR